MRKFQVQDGMAKSIFHNKYSRQDPETGVYQDWAERTKEVVEGNFALVDPVGVGTNSEERAAFHLQHQQDLQRTLELAQSGVMPFSGRHLQHGDAEQPSKFLETFTNCSTAMFSWANFYLLMKGSGVGRCFDSAICRVQWDNLPNVRLVLEGPDNKGLGGHPDYESWIENARDAHHQYDSESEQVRWFTVEDTAEGWVKIVEILETASWQAKHKDKLYIFDFTNVRAKGTPIMGQQGRPASGPVPLIRALHKVISVKGAGLQPWKQAVYIDHALSECVAVGGIRRAARIGVKSWRDKDVFEYIDIKRGGFLWSANLSVGVDEEFWAQAATQAPSHGRRVFEAMCSAAYFDNTGEPGYLNVDKLTQNDAGMEGITAESIFGKRMLAKLNLHPKTLDHVAYTLAVAKKQKYVMITNPCGEIPLAIFGGYCVIADLGLANVENLQEALDAAGLTAKFLVRTNLMPCLYEAEVQRTNRIGVSFTGIHEFAFKHFQATWKDLQNDQEGPGLAFWDFVNQMRLAAEGAAEQYSKQLGVSTPHTVTAVKPAGTIAKVLSCTEGAHLPAYAWYMRWVQFGKDSAEAKDLLDRGYPLKDISHQYPGQIVIGFPTKMPIVDVMGEQVTLAGEASIDEQYQWIRLIEKHWFGGPGKNAQVSYTGKYNPKKIDYLDFMQIIRKNQSTVRACSLMPQVDMSAYAYQPEERLTLKQYEKAMARITDKAQEEAYDDTLLSCEGGVCPIEPDRYKAKVAPTEG